MWNPALCHRTDDPVFALRTGGVRPQLRNARGAPIKRFQKSSWRAFSAFGFSPQDQQQGFEGLLPGGIS
jgi:hypothetical protein